MTAKVEDMAGTIDLAAIEAAARTLKGAIVETPFAQSRTLSAMLGCEIWLKFENLQFTGAYKERGALNKLTSLSPAERTAGVIAMSAGKPRAGRRISRFPPRYSRYDRDAGGNALREGREHACVGRPRHPGRRDL